MKERQESQSLLSKDSKKRCEWAYGSLLEMNYHDTEWGVPVHDDHRLFEFLTLEGAQAGLSWVTVLKKRENYRKAFDNFDAQKIAGYSREKIEQLLQNYGIIRNRLKIEAAVRNARVFINIQNEFGSFDAYIWQFVHGITIQNARKNLHEIPAKTKESEAMSMDLKRRGLRFVGPTICYAFMQAVGMVNDHIIHCFRYPQLL